MENIDIGSLDYNALQEFMAAQGEKAFRAKQIYEWLHVKLADNFDDMTNLSKDLRGKLKSICELTAPNAVMQITSKIDGTCKFLFRLKDDRIIESVLMRYKHGNSVCISSQAGCRMGCRFCASAIGGLERSLTAYEMLGQIYQIQKISGERVSNVVVMGTGEPFDNYENLVSFIRMLTDEHGLNISQRNITVSTCGLVDRIRAFAEEEFQVTLAISLHASNDEERKKLMPVANKYDIASILEACRYYFDRTGRRITFEYSMIQGENDSADTAKELCGLLKGMNCHVNLIPVNPVKERDYKQASKDHIVRFQNILEGKGINVTIRRELGSDIDAACGQLRKSYMDDHIKEQG